ncbi:MULTISPECIES: copper resistance CopC family protein [Paenarthrobacter]|jgi:copper resistance protein C|uniref:copper resistance CopC family protein n=1 Tax=Paenarthrobacter TaxID=1742992 RepID=UPI00236708EF|nr:MULTISPECIES: copper resistance CopC family protein [Paenarthrobacter]MDD7834676.1 copper resistance protein CopC [Paenarthrobacter sp. AB444]MDP9936386.1 methionine-rich copper-binding protein CopC [Paenarthrobacter nicotinovorans]
MRTIRPLLAAVVAAFAFASALLFSAAPASAHDVAESTAPANGATVAEVPASVSITFNNRPLAIGSGVTVTAGGENWADGPVEIIDSQAVQKLRPGAPAGEYTVVWRVVSSDSHPIEGTFKFTATAGSTTAASGTAAASPSGSATSATVPSVGSAPPGTGSSAPAADASQPFPWSIVVIAAVAVALVIFLAVTARRKLAASDDPEGPASAE